MSRRFGAPKAGAEVGGVSLVRRVAAALRAADLPVGVVVAAAEQAAEMNLPVRLDGTPGAGPLGGLQAALRWAAEEGRPGAVCVACDLPFVPAGLLRHLAERGATGAADAVVPASPVCWGWEPLCAFYSVRALPRVADLLRRGEHRLGALIATLHADVVPPAQVRVWGRPEVIFLNVNSPADRERAERIAAHLARDS